MGRPMYGSAMRAEKGKSKLSSAEAQVLSNMASMIAAHLPALSEKPVNSEEFNTQVKNFQGFLRTEYQDSTRLPPGGTRAVPGPVFADFGEGHICSARPFQILP